MKDTNKQRTQKPLDELTSVQYEVTQKGGTEQPFQNEFCDHKEEGIYVDLVSGEPLFSSVHKFDSGSGWPSFYEALAPAHINEITDRAHGMVRTEVRSTEANSHLGHVFPDGPAPSGLRYCINSAALRFIPRDELKDQGYEEFLNMFND